MLVFLLPWLSSFAAMFRFPVDSSEVNLSTQSDLKRNLGDFGLFVYGKSSSSLDTRARGWWTLFPVLILILSLLASLYMQMRLKWPNYRSSLARIFGKDELAFTDTTQPQNSKLVGLGLTGSRSFTLFFICVLQLLLKTGDLVLMKEMLESWILSLSLFTSGRFSNSITRSATDPLVR